MERDNREFYLYNTNTDFNSHAHVERDLKVASIGNALVISTHTLTWSVTLSVTKPMKTVNNFNSHAHVERDILFITILVSNEPFQLTRSRGA